MTTAFMTLTAWARAAPRVDSFTGLRTLKQAASLMLITPALRLAACTTARARLRMVPAAGVWLGSFWLAWFWSMGSKASEVRRTEISRASGATPTNLWSVPAARRSGRR